jgi:hypothetical protein
VSCCGHPVREGPLESFTERPAIGKCKWTESFFMPNPITGKDGKAANIGVFEVTW